MIAIDTEALNVIREHNAAAEAHIKEAVASVDAETAIAHALIACAHALTALSTRSVGDFPRSRDGA